MTLEVEENRVYDMSRVQRAEALTSRQRGRLQCDEFDVEQSGRRVAIVWRMHGASDEYSSLQCECHWCGHIFHGQSYLGGPFCGGPVRLWGDVTGVSIVLVAASP